jgi:hypothetical protein
MNSLIPLFFFLVLGGFCLMVIGALFYFITSITTDARLREASPYVFFGGLGMAIIGVTGLIWPAL